MQWYAYDKSEAVRFEGLRTKYRFVFVSPLFICNFYNSYKIKIEKLLTFTGVSVIMVAQEPVACATILKRGGEYV